MDLRAHAILNDVPLHDVWRLDLPGGGEGRTVLDVRTLGMVERPNPAVRALFWIRWMLGSVFRWDAKSSDDSGLFQHRLTDGDREHSMIETGTRDGPFTVLYVFPHEAVSEIRNATVHAALVWTLTRRGGGYRLLWAIYVKPVGRLTGFYMRLIEPFRRWIVYPSLLRRLHRSWCATYQSD